MKINFAILLLVSVTACASHKVIIEREGVDMAKYERDLDACKQYAEEVDSGAEVGKSALGGAVVGGAVGAILGGRRSAERLAGVGAVTGAAHGAGSAGREKNTVVKNCLRGRGYKVLN